MAGNKGRRLVAVGMTMGLVGAAALGTASQSQGEAGDARQKLFPKPMDLIITEAELPAVLADMERNPAKYDDLDIGVQMGAGMPGGAIGHGMDQALAAKQQLEAGR